MKPKLTHGKIVFVAVLVEDEGKFAIADCLNEMLRPAMQDRKNSGIVDYGFNLNVRELNGIPVPSSFDIPSNYNEGLFTCKNVNPLSVLVKEYLDEHTNPAPDPILRASYRSRMADLIGVEDPLLALRRWNKANRTRAKA